MFTMIRLGHVGVWEYPWQTFLDALDFEHDLTGKAN